MNPPRHQELKSLDQQVDDLREANRQLEKEVSERIKAEQALRDAVLKYRIVADNTYDWEFWKAPSGEVLYVSPSCKRITGIDASEFYEYPDFLNRIIHPDDLSAWVDHRCAALAGHEAASMTFRIRHSDSSERWIEHVCQPVHDDQGRFLGVRGSNRDISKRKRAEEALRHERDRAQSYLDTVETVIVTLDSEGRITTINRKGCQLLDHTEDELIGQFWFATCLPQPYGTEKVYPYFLKLMSGELEAAEYFENPIVTRNGELRQIAWHNALLRDEHGRIIGTLSSGEDVTERRKAEQELKIANEILEAKHAALREKNLALKNVLEQVSSEKQLLKAQIQSNVDRVVKPTLRLLRQKVDVSTASFVDLLDSNLQDIASPLANRLQSNYASLSPGEIAIYSMIENGLSSQEMANLRGVSVQTISMQRKRIRRKLGIANQSVSLPSLLKSLTH